MQRVGPQWSSMGGVGEDYRLREQAEQYREQLAEERRRREEAERERDELRRELEEIRPRGRPWWVLGLLIVVVVTTIVVLSLGAIISAP